WSEPILEAAAGDPHASRLLKQYLTFPNPCRQASKPHVHGAALALGGDQVSRPGGFTERELDVVGSLHCHPDPGIVSHQRGVKWPGGPEFVQRLFQHAIVIGPVPAQRTVALVQTRLIAPAKIEQAARAVDDRLVRHVPLLGKSREAQRASALCDAA